MRMEFEERARGDSKNDWTELGLDRLGMNDNGLRANGLGWAVLRTD